MRSAVAYKRAGKLAGFPAGGGFFGASPPGVKLIASNYTATVAGGLDTTFFSINTPLISTIPPGRAWRIHTMCSAQPAALADTFFVQLNIFGGVVANGAFPQYTGAWASPAFGGGNFDMECIIVNPNAGGVWQWSVKQIFNARGAAPADTDMGIQTTEGSALFSSLFPLRISASSNLGHATVTHLQTTVEQLQ
jgi:hypothetical protein